ncbi:MAG: winged helix-turn-helix domain-containing protein [Candidatus Nanoarchaeia archaeon]
MDSIKKQIISLIIGEGLTPKKASERLKISRKTVFKHLKKLIQQGVITRTRRGGYYLSAYQGVTGEEYYRLHNVRVFYELPRIFDKQKWKRNVGRFLSLRKIAHSRGYLGSNAYESFWVFDRLKAYAHANGVLVFFPELKGEAVDVVYSKLCSVVFEVGFELNRLFGREFFSEGSSVVRLVQAELSHVKDKLAEAVVEAEKKVFVWDQGELRLSVDLSRGPELEFHSVGWSFHDAEIISRVLKEYLVKDVLLPYEVSKQIYAAGLNDRMLLSQLEALKVRVSRLENERGM